MYFHHHHHHHHYHYYYYYYYFCYYSYQSIYTYIIYLCLYIIIIYCWTKGERRYLYCLLLFHNFLYLHRTQGSETLFIDGILFENNTNNLYLFYYLFQFFAFRQFSKLISLNDATQYSLARYFTLIILGSACRGLFGTSK